MYFLILFLIALAVSALGFKKFLWFISLGYGFSIAALGLAMIIIFSANLSITSFVLAMWLVLYGLRLGIFLLVRERSSASYNASMKREINDGSDYSLAAKLAVWISCALLYVCEVSPVLFRLQNNVGTDAAATVGVVIMTFGFILESVADSTKSAAKQKNPHTFCREGVFKIVRCPNYLGEMIIWSGVLISGLSALQGFWQWLAALAGWVCIIYIMFGGARRLEIRQNKNYGHDPAYQRYVKRTPILLPFIPLYSVEKWTWLRG